MLVQNLSDDPEAKSVIDTMKQGIIMLGATPDTSIEKMFDELVDKSRVNEETNRGTGLTPLPVPVIMFT